MTAASSPASTRRLRTIKARVRPKLEVRGARACRIRVADDDEIGDRALPDRLQDLWNEGAALFGQFVGFESKVQREALRRQAGGRSDASPKIRSTSDSLSTVTGAGGSPADTTVDSRAVSRVAEPEVFETVARPTVLLSESGSRTVSACPGRSGVRTRRGPQADDQAGGDDRAQNGDRPRVVHSGVTRRARVVPRTPTMAVGVSRRMESGESLAIRPDT